MFETYSERPLAAQHAGQALLAPRLQARRLRLQVQLAKMSPKKGQTKVKAEGGEGEGKKKAKKGSKDRKGET